MSLWRKSSDKKVSTDGSSPQDSSEDATSFADRGKEALRKELRKLKENWSQGQKESGRGQMIPQEQVEAFISDPIILDRLTIDRLRDLQIIVKGTLEANERDLTDEERTYLKKLNNAEVELQTSTPVIGEILKSWLPKTARKKQEFIDRLSLLLNLIDSKLTRRAETPEQPLREAVPNDFEQRERLLEKMEGLRSQRNSHRSKMELGGASEDEIRRFENLFDNAIHNCEVELQKLLIK